MAIELGKPAEYGQFILERRFSLAKTLAHDAIAKNGFYLDVGCGNGAQTIYFANQFDKWMAVDVEEKPPRRIPPRTETRRLPRSLEASRNPPLRW